VTLRGPTVVVALLALSCKPAPDPAPQRPRQPAPIVIALPAAPLSLDASAGMEEFSRTVLGNVYETLVDRDAELRLRPTIAESWQTVDDRTWVFRIRDRVRLHDGRILTAGLVRECFERLRLKRLDAGLSLIASLEAPDDHTLRVVTREPVPQLPSRLWSLLHWPDSRRPEGAAVGTGPYRIVSSVPGGDTLLEAFPGYWQGAPAVPALSFRVVGDAPARARGIRQGEIQVVVDPTADELPALAQEPGVRVVAERGLRVIFLGMDCATVRSPHTDAPRNPFRDRRVREAVALAVDREAVVKGPLRGYADVVDQIVAPEVIGSAVGLPRRAHDPARARALLSEAGFAKGFAVDLDFTPHKYRAMDLVAAYLAESLRDVGIVVRLRRQEPQAFFDRVDRRDSAFYLYGWMTTQDASISYEELLHTPRPGRASENAGGYSDAELDALIERVNAAPASKEARGVFAQLARKVLAEVPVVPLYRQRDLYVVGPGVTFQPRLDRGIQGRELRREQ
jgi:peptide/nickel transport system substrate-binding protein